MAQLTLESNSVQVVKDNLLRLLVDFLLLAEDNITLALDGTLLKLAVLQNVRDNVDGRTHVLAERLCVVDGLLARGVSIQVCAEVLNLKLETVLRALASTCEASKAFQVSNIVMDSC